MSEQHSGGASGLPDRAQVVIVGGGIIGAGIAYHLTRRDITDVVVLEQNQLTSGTTWHAAGLVSQLKASHALTQLATYSARLFEELEDETGQATGYRRPGSISVADNAERWEEILRSAALAQTIGVETRVLDLDEAGELWPLMRTDDLVGALHIPHDGQTSPVDTTMALMKGARARGARVIEGVSVTDVSVVDGRVTGVETEQGVIESETVVLAAGMWTRHLAQRIGVDVPLQACEHYYLVTEPLDGIQRGTPTLRDPGNYTYFKEETGKVMAGFFEPRGKVWSLDGIDRTFSFGTLPEDWDHVGPIFERAIHRVPALGECGIQLLFNGPESFTPDGVCYLGEAPTVDGCFVAAGFNSVGIQLAGGVGWALADQIADGIPSVDLTAVDLRRAQAFQTEPDYLAERIPESLGLLYAMHWPYQQYESGRDRRLSPLHQRLDAAGAVFGETGGWERPNWYARPGQERRYEYSFGRQNWFENLLDECRAVRERVGLFDQTSFAQFLVEGPDALLVLDAMSVASIDRPVMTTAYTQWCNDGGGIEADLTITRLGEQRFLVVTGAGARIRDLAWLRRAARDHVVTIDDLTERRSMLSIMGPSSRDVLSTLTDTALGADVFPFGTGQYFEVAGIEVLGLRMTYVGELGWELYVAATDAVALFDALVGAGEPHGLALAGYHAMDSLRLEAGYRHYGHDLCDQDTPIEAGLGFVIDWKSEIDFRGRAALQAQKDMPRSKRLIQFRLDDPTKLGYHDEPIFRDGELVGRTTSGMWSQTEERSLAMGYVNHEDGVTADWLDSGSFEIDIAGSRTPATTSIRSFYDPKNERTKM